MAPNNNARRSPTSVIDLTPIVTIGVRDYDIDVTEQMFRMHFRSLGAQNALMCQWYEDILVRLDRIRRGITVVWIPDVNTGIWLHLEEWFTRYGYAPDMLLLEREEWDGLGAYVDNEARAAVRPPTPMPPTSETDETASITLGSQDTISVLTQEADFFEFNTQEAAETMADIFDHDDKTVKTKV
jgi:hypothetical protein